LAYIFSHENSPEDYAKFSAGLGRKEAHDEIPSYVENKPRDRGRSRGYSELTECGLRKRVQMVF